MTIENYSDDKLRKIIRSEMKWYRRRATIAFILLFIGFTLGYFITSQVFHDNQKLQNEITVKQARIKVDSIHQRCELTEAIVHETKHLGIKAVPIIDENLQSCYELQHEAEASVQEAEERLKS